MRNRNLHDALRAFALEAAMLLRDDQNAGAELEFDLSSGSAAPRRGPTLYHYRPLTARYIAERWPRLRCLPTCGPAAEALGAGAAAYLRVNGLRGAESEPALQAMLERLYEDLTDFTFPEERFERVYSEVERTLYERSHPATVLVPVHGLQLHADHVDLGDGLALVRGERADAPDDAVWAAQGGEATDVPNTLLTLTRDVPPDESFPVDEARTRFRRLITGMRLWKPGGIALGCVAWRRTGEGVWQPFELEQTGVARAEPWILVEGEEVELAAFLDAISRATHGGAVAWALSRFEMGSGRRLESEALSDYLLALRALVDPGAGDNRSSLSLRVAVLCAADEERRGVQRRVELAQALERFVMGDGAGDDYLDAIGSDSPRTLVDEVERHLRALLRDVLCGFLDPDLRAVADELLLEQPRPVPAPAPAAVPATVAAREPEQVSFDEYEYEQEDDFEEEEPEPVTTEIAALEASDEEIGVAEMTPVAEWDDDPASYSAPV